MGTTGEQVLLTCVVQKTIQKRMIDIKMRSFERLAQLVSILGPRS